MKRFYMIFMAILILIAAPCSAGWLFWDEGNISSYVARSGLDSQLGINVGSSIFAASGSSDKIYKFSSGVWAENYTPSSVNTPTAIFVDSRGYIFSAWAITGAPSKLFRSIDGGDNWTQVDTSTGNDASIRFITEDNDGNLYLHNYPTYEWKYSTDGGANWSALTLPTDYLTTYPTHGHSIYWCPYRNVLLISGGDTTDANIYYTSLKASAITADGWSKISNTHQCVAITSNADYIFASHDSNTEQGWIYRVPWAVGGSPGTPEDVYTPATNGQFAWNADVDQNGYIWFVLSNSMVPDGNLVVSYDGGSSWEIAKSFAYTGNPAKGPYLFAQASDYYESWDGFYYGSSGDVPFGRWRFYPDSSTFKLNSSGSDIADGVTSAWPLNAFYHNESLLSGDSKFLFQNEATIPITIYSDSVCVDFSGYEASGAVTDSPEFSQDFEGAFSWEGNWGANYDTANDSTDFAVSGTKSYRVTATADGSAGYQGKMLSEISVTDGGTVWLSGYVYLSSMFAGNCSLVGIDGAGQAVTIELKNTGVLGLKTVGIATASEQVDSIAGIITAESWHKIKLRVDVADAGKLILWVDDTLVVSAIGIDTYDSAVWVSCWFGVYGNMGDGNVIYWDDVTFSDTDPDQPSDIEILGDKARLYNLNATTMDIAASKTAMLLDGFSLTTLTKGADAHALAFDPWNPEAVGSDFGADVHGAIID